MHTEVWNPRNQMPMKMSFFSETKQWDAYENKWFHSTCPVAATGALVPLLIGLQSCLYVHVSFHFLAVTSVVCMALFYFDTLNIRYKIEQNSSGKFT